MASSQTLVTPRDLDLFTALDRTPLTAAQVLTLSETFALPFTSERCVRERLHRLCAAGRVRRWHYATAGRGALGYYTLTRLGYQLLHGPQAIPRRHLGNQIAVASQSHARALADVIVHTAVAAHRSHAVLTVFCPENTLRLQLGDDFLYPDSTFRLLLPEGRTYSFFDELDNGSQAVTSPKDLESWERKIRFYDRYQDQSAERFRVRIISTRSHERLQHLLDLAAALTRVPERSLFCGVTLAEYLAHRNPILEPCFQNHRGQKAALASVPRGVPATLLRTATVA